MTLSRTPGTLHPPLESFTATGKLSLNLVSKFWFSQAAVMPFRRVPVGHAGLLLVRLGGVSTGLRMKLVMPISYDGDLGQTIDNLLDFEGARRKN
jgi:hypothetical protein